MSLLNYTTNISPDKTAQEIAKELSMHGARSVLTEYDESNGSITAISFRMKVGDQDIGFRLPCDWRPVLEILQNDPKVPRPRKTQEQAVKTAWRIVKDWVEAQMALVETKMVSAEEVFLSYAIMKDGSTLFEKIVKSKFLLGSGE